MLKPAGKAMVFLSFLFELENKLQAKLLGAEDSDFVDLLGEKLRIPFTKTRL